ncbi:hypothetical protein GGI43DRAFT_159140 [Trichoderma evansii]
MVALGSGTPCRAAYQRRFLLWLGPSPHTVGTSRLCYAVSVQLFVVPTCAVLEWLICLCISSFFHPFVQSSSFRQGSRQDKERGCSSIHLVERRIHWPWKHVQFVTASCCNINSTGWLRNRVRQRPNLSCQSHGNQPAGGTSKYCPVPAALSHRQFSTHRYRHTPSLHNNTAAPVFFRRGASGLGFSRSLQGPPKGPPRLQASSITSAS